MAEAHHGVDCFVPGSRGKTVKPWVAARKFSPESLPASHVLVVGYSWQICSWDVLGNFMGTQNQDAPCHVLENRNHVHMFLFFLLSGLFSDISASLEIVLLHHSKPIRLSHNKHFRQYVISMYVRYIAPLLHDTRSKLSQATRIPTWCSWNIVPWWVVASASFGRCIRRLTHLILGWPFLSP